MQRALGTTLAELRAPWCSLAASGLVAPTQVPGEVIHDDGAIEALRVPSARDPSTGNLRVFPDRLRIGSSVRVSDDSGLIDAHLP